MVRKAKAREVKAKKQGSPSNSNSATAFPASTSTATPPRPPTQLGSLKAADEDMVVAVKRDRQFPNFLTSTVTVMPNLASLSYRTLGPTLEERATSFFVSNYVVGIKGPTRGHLSSLETTYHFDDNLMASIKAVGLAGFANVENSAAVMKEARREYATALRLTNSALRSPVDAKRDSTLLSIMILSIYETVAGNNQKSFKSWAEHIHGAAALVKLRGLDQLQTAEGRRMVIQVTSNLLISCIQRAIALPNHILDLRAEIKKLIDESEPAWQVQELMIKFCAFRAARNNGAINDPRIILANALEIDDQFMTIFTNPPLSWRYETRYSNMDAEHVWNGSYHVYYDYWVAQLWNAMRTCRMLLHEAIRDALLQGFQSRPPVFSGIEHTAQFQLSTDILYQMQAEVLASVPQHIGFSPSRSRASDPGTQSVDKMQPLTFNDSAARISPVLKSFIEPHEASSSDPLMDTDLPVLRASGGYFLMWPLFLAAAVDVASSESQSWAIGRLRSIGKIMGIRQAYVLAAIVENKSSIHEWMTEPKVSFDGQSDPYLETQEVELDDEDFM